MYDITFFVPCYNEEDNVERTLAAVCAAASKTELSFEIIVVDDQSIDSTRTRVQQFIKQCPELAITLIENRTNVGLGRNYIDVSFRSRGKYYMLVNGDGAEPEETILTILNEIGKADMVIPYFGSEDNRSASRICISRLFTWLVNLISGYTIRYYNGPVAHRRFNVMRWSPDTHGYAYQAELIVRILQEGGTYLEVKVENSDREQGSSKAFRMLNLLSVGHSILQIFLRRLRRVVLYQRS